MLTMALAEGILTVDVSSAAIGWIGSLNMRLAEGITTLIASSAQKGGLK